MHSNYVHSGIGRIRWQDGQRVLSQSRNLEAKVKRLDPKRYRGFIENISSLFGMLSDYWTGNYSAMPWTVVAAIIFALLYFLNPADLIPDIIPGLGYIDDASVVGIVVASIEHHIGAYRHWKQRSLLPGRRRP